MTTPTQAQIEAGEYDLKCTNGHDRCYMGTSDDCPYCEKVALTAAQVEQARNNAQVERYILMAHATIEHFIDWQKAWEICQCREKIRYAEKSPPPFAELKDEQ